MPRQEVDPVQQALSMRRNSGRAIRRSAIAETWWRVTSNNRGRMQPASRRLSATRRCDPCGGVSALGLGNLQPGEWRAGPTAARRCWFPDGVNQDQTETGLERKGGVKKIRY